MSKDIPPQLSASLRIVELEDQVKGLMETVIQFHEMYGLEAINIPKPDKYVKEGGYTVTELQQRYAHRPALSATPATTTATQETTVLSEPPKPKPKPEAAKESKSSVTVADVPSLPQYTYAPLNAAASEIRLLALDTTGRPDDPIICRLIIASLDDAAECPPMFKSAPIECFTPLSYCWGTSSFTEHIVVDGHSFSVTPSLYNALRHFRKAVPPPEDPFKRFQGDKAESYWWIDAICVNQNDVTERSSQVGLMTRLYKAAHMVHVWLGDEGDNSTQAMRLIRDLAYIPETPEDIESWNYIPKKAGQTYRPDGPGRPMVKLPVHETTFLSEQEKLDNYAAIIRFYQRPWFSRVWIRQEIALPSDVIFHCGAETCNWKDVMRAADILTYFADEYHMPALQHDGLRDTHSFGSCFRKALGLYELREEISRRGGSYGELQVLALKWRDCLATDPRDKVFAMLPLTNPDETDVRADYAKDKQKLYRDTTLSLLRKNLDYLSGCQNPTRSNGLPSWVPDLEVPSRPLLTETNYGHDKSLVNHWGNPPEDVAKFEHVPSEARLDIHGVIFDEVQAINEDDYIEAESSNKDVRTISERWREFHESHRDALFEEWEEQGNWEARDECLRMFDVPFNDSEWQFHILGNTDGDTYREGGDRDGVRFKRWDDDNVDHDPTLKRVKRLLPSDGTPFSDVLGREDEYFANLRPLAIGRRMFFSSRGAIGLIPIEAITGDKVCFFDGCGCPFVIRRAGNETWVIVGQAYYFGRIVLYEASKKPKKTIIRIV
ncbi:heterokaryon incompatibility protein [Metarhizium robertsii ARSEF 23]|uniref:Heterokaryon incompatibility protein n=1 Tax=Metarhizium robertsii (strain ARSEF 23 / ATCC MYA-3075) TaxID=655844 RepID=E9ENU3_METRA|nr:heterokaryon incompatibility protein [Metarhizium robertsii ARSEF 23]EFZ02213.2 heterokaryon incompatibility protein [Metarhizium robertsii ARSEF 23]